MLRFAPFPDGDMCISSLRVAILNYLTAQTNGEPFLVRIDDTDREKVVEGKDTEIMQIMEKFALKHDIVYHQSEHLRMHQTLALRLLEEDKAFICTCQSDSLSDQCSGICPQRSKEELRKIKEQRIPFVIRLKAPEHDIVITDVFGDDITTVANEINNFAILNADNTPTSLFAAACDDMVDNISLIIRSAEQSRQSPKEHHIQAQLGYQADSSHLHIPPLFSATGEPISEVTIKSLFEEGIVPDAILNYLLLLDLSDTPKEIFTLPEAINWFKLENLTKKAVEFDIGKLLDINREHLRKMDDKRLSSLFGFADADIGKLAKLYLDETSTINGLETKIKGVFAPKNFDNAWTEEMHTLQSVIIEAPMLNDYDTFKSYLLQKSKLEEADLDTPLRLLLTGTQEGPEISEIYPFIKPYLLEVIS